VLEARSERSPKEQLCCPSVEAVPLDRYGIIGHPKSDGRHELSIAELVRERKDGFEGVSELSTFSAVVNMRDDLVSTHSLQSLGAQEHILYGIRSPGITNTLDGSVDAPLHTRLGIAGVRQIGQFVIGLRRVQFVIVRIVIVIVIDDR